MNNLWSLTWLPTILFLSGFVQSYQLQDGTALVDSEQILRTIGTLHHDMEQQKTIIRAQNDVIRNLEGSVQRYESQMEEMRSMLKELHQSASQDITTSINNFQQPDIGAIGQHTEFGCVSDIITLSCPEGRYINVVSADYGMYNFACDSGCCAPHPTDDCRELVEQNRPEDWLAILYYCNNQTSCTYENGGSPINECQEGYIADYLQIFYQCTPVSIDEPVGFAAYAPSTETYASGEVAKFPSVVTNLGGYYDATTSVFICPLHGVYLITLNQNAGYDETQYSASIMRETVALSSALAYASNHRAQASATAVTECSAGEQVWIRGTGEMLGGGAKSSHFTGYLLHRY